MANNQENELISQLIKSAYYELDVGRSKLFDAAAREIEKLEIELQKAVNERNEAWSQLEEENIEINSVSVIED